MDRSDRTRNGILELVDRHIFRFGFASLTMEQAAALAGVSKRTLYKYFPNKESLLEAVIENRFTTIGGRIEDALTKTEGDWLRKYSMVLRVLGEFIGTLQPVMMRDLATGDPRFWAKIRAFREDKVFSVLSRIIMEARAQGDIRMDLDPRIIMTLFISFIDDIANPNRLIALPYSMQEVISTMANIFFQGILSEAGRTRLPPIRFTAAEAGDAVPNGSSVSVDGSVSLDGGNK